MLVRRPLPLALAAVLALGFVPAEAGLRTAVTSLGPAPAPGADADAAGSASAPPGDGGLDASASPDGDDPHVRSESLDWVARVAYPVANSNSRTARTDVQGGTDLELFTLTVGEGEDARELDLAAAGTYENGFQLVDVTDPTAPELLTTYDCDIYQGDVQVDRRADGRTLVFFGVDYTADLTSECYTDLPPAIGVRAQQASGIGTLVFDVTDPTAVTSVGFVPTAGGTHNATVRGFDSDDDGVLDQHLLYNSENDAGGALQVWDVTDVAAPGLVAELPLADGGATDTHDVTFNADGTRAYVASINSSYVLDTSDPTTPTIVTRIVDPAVGIHHQADPLTVETPLGERTVVIISDEIAGAAGNGYCPGGGLHVWDVTDELAPVKLGAWFMPDITVQEGATTGAGGTVSCTAHVYRLYPDQGIMTIGNMAGGVRVLDVSEVVGVGVGTANTSTGDLAGIRDLGWHRFSANDVRGSDSWTFKAHPDRFEDDGSFFGFSNDQTRGFEVFRFDASKPAEPAAGDAERGRWASPGEALRRMQDLRAVLDTDALSWSCRLPGQLRG